MNRRKKPELNNQIQARKVIKEITLAKKPKNPN